MHSPRSLLFAALLLFLSLNFAYADGNAIQLRDDSPQQSTTVPPATTNPATSSTDNNEQQTSSKGDSSSSATATDKSHSISSTSSSSPTSTSPPTITANLNGPVYTGDYYNATLHPYELPIQPEITPAFAVGGVILMITGAAYTFIGIKNKMLHIALSTAYLTSLSVLVLILYLLSPPVSNAIEGAYLVAIVMTGLILGGGSVIFKEMTEGLGALLGGFCLSMWLLVLVPGGLLKTTSHIAIFISCFTVVAFATTFSHYTRPYGLIGGISFGGSTVTVLGIDCFSRAGLKEFWAYIWNLNGNMFPLGATTYPLTRGMKVEIAAIVVVFLLGLVSQMKLWLIIKQKREQRAQLRLEDERNLEAEEAGVGKRVEHITAVERGDWEAVYGDKDATMSSSDSAKKGTSSTITAVQSDGDEIEMSDMPQGSNMKGAGLVMGNSTDGTVTVRVIEDDIPEGAEVTSVRDHAEDVEAPKKSTTPIADAEGGSKSVWVVGADGEARPASIHNAKRDSKRKSGGPQVIPLPFKIPDDETKSNRSSVATFNDDDERRHSKRFSTGSGLMRSLSKKSNLSGHRLSRNTISRENLVGQPGEDDTASVAANFDEDTDDDDLAGFGADLERRLSQVSSHHSVALEPKPLRIQTQVDRSADSPITSPIKSPNFLEVPSRNSFIGKKSSESSSPVKEADANLSSLTSDTNPKSSPNNDSKDVENAEPSAKDATSAVPEKESTPAPLTKEVLPQAQSKVVLSYRTNEWAKHLSHADAPEPDELSIAQPIEDTTEAPVPVNVVELQQTPQTAAVLPLPQMSTHESQVNSRGSYDPYKSPEVRPDLTPLQSSTASMPNLASQAMLHSVRNSSNPSIAIEPMVESPIDYSRQGLATLPESQVLPQSATPTFQLPPFSQTAQTTLLGQRDSYLRAKSSLGFSPGLPTTPEVAMSVHSSSSRSPPASVVGSGRDSRLEDDNITLAARRNIMRQNSTGSQSQNMYMQTALSTPNMPITRSQSSFAFFPPIGNSSQDNINGTMRGPANFDSHQPQRISAAPTLARRESQLAEFRASLANDMKGDRASKQDVDASRNILMTERLLKNKERQVQERRRIEAEKERDRQLRANRGDMLGAHREAMRKMQRKVNLEGDNN